MGGRSRLETNLRAVEERIAATCARAGRPRSDVTLVAVTKTVASEVVRWLYDMGVRDFGESRPQQLWEKAAESPAEIRWHLIGHLQRNKVARTLPLVTLIHSVDSRRLLEAIEAEATRQELVCDVLLEFNLSREPNKSGFAPEDAAEVAESLGTLRSVRVRGLMTMAAMTDDPRQARPVFAELRGLRDEMQLRLGSRHRLEHLSMGMTQDFEVAIEEGATLVRIGSALFEGVS
jgi:pyridoxal phosphate enzyme (YggS family)